MPFEFFPDRLFTRFECAGDFLLARVHYVDESLGPLVVVELARFEHAHAEDLRGDVVAPLVEDDEAQQDAEERQEVVEKDVQVTSHNGAPAIASA